MPATSAGILPYRVVNGRLEVLLVHPGGPYFSRKDFGAWSIAKGMVNPGEDHLVAAIRELVEETGIVANGEFIPLRACTLKSGKIVEAWAVEHDCDAAGCVSNHFEMEWPRGSGRMQSFPEVDRVEWFEPDEALRRINPAQRGFIDELQAKLSTPPRT